MRKFFLMAMILFLLMLACNSPGSVPATEVSTGSGTAPTTGSGPAVPGGNNTGETTGAGAPVECPAPAPTPTPQPTPIPSMPVSVRSGLASLNSYVLVVKTTITSSESSSATLTNIETQYNKDLDAQFMHMLMIMPGEEGEEPSQTDTYTYEIGNAACTGNDTDGWEYSTLTPQQKESQTIFSQMVDLLPIIDDPVLMGQEAMNGVESNHFTFQMSGVGAESGVDVVANQGEYWLAIDGQYLVRYTLLIETIDPNSQETLRSEYLIDLTSINQAVNIAFPQGCLDAQANP